MIKMDINSLIKSAAMVLDTTPVSATRFVTVGIIAHTGNMDLAAIGQEIPNDVALDILAEMAMAVTEVGAILASENS